MTIANVALTHTFDTWRVRTNDVIQVTNGLQNGSGFANVASLKIQGVGTTGQFLKIANATTGLITAATLATPTVAFSSLTGYIANTQFRSSVGLSNTTITGNFTANTVGTLKTLGNISTLNITGGASGESLTTNGTGGLSFVKKLSASNNLSDLASASTARTNLGLGSIATQASSSVSITGGSISGITDLAVADGGTGASNAATARSNLGLGTAATVNTGTSGATIPLLNGTNTFSGTQTFDDAVRGSVTALTSSAASIAINANDGIYFSHTFTENTTLANPSNLTAGQEIVIFFTQHASSPKTLAFGSYWDTAGGTVPSVTATNSAVDVLVGVVINSTKILFDLKKDVK